MRYSISDLWRWPCFHFRPHENLLFAPLRASQPHSELEHMRQGRQDHCSFQRRVQGSTSTCFNLFLLLGVIITSGFKFKGGRGCDWMGLSCFFFFFQIALIHDLYKNQPPSDRNAGSVCKLPVDLWSVWKHTVRYFLRPVSLHSNGVCLFWDNEETWRY